MLVILCRLPEKGRKEIEDIVEEMKERQGRKRNRKKSEKKTKKKKKKKKKKKNRRNKIIPPLPLLATRIAGLEYQLDAPVMLNARHLRHTQPPQILNIHSLNNKNETILDRPKLLLLQNIEVILISYILNSGTLLQLSSVYEIAEFLPSVS